MFRLLGQGVGRLQKGDEDAVSQGDGRPGGFGTRMHTLIIVVITIIVKRKTLASYFQFRVSASAEGQSRSRSSAGLARRWLPRSGRRLPETTPSRCPLRHAW